MSSRYLYRPAQTLLPTEGAFHAEEAGATNGTREEACMLCLSKAHYCCCHPCAGGPLPFAASPGLHSPCQWQQEGEQSWNAATP